MRNGSILTIHHHHYHHHRWYLTNSTIHEKPHLPLPLPLSTFINITIIEASSTLSHTASSNMLRFPIVPFESPAPSAPPAPSSPPPSPPSPPTLQLRQIRGWTSLKRCLRSSPVFSESSSEDTLQTAPTTIASSDDKLATWMKVQEDVFSRYSSSIYSQDESQSANGSLRNPSMQRPPSPIAPLFSSSPSGKYPVCCFRSRLLDTILTFARSPLPVATLALTKSAAMTGLSLRRPQSLQAWPRRSWGWII